MLALLVGLLFLGCSHFIYCHHIRAKAIIADLKKGSFINLSGLSIPRYISLADREFDLDTLPTTLFFILLLHEDTSFIRHKGFNTKEMLRALKSSLFRQKIRGGSSISQQIAKRLFTDGSIYFFKKGNNLLQRKLVETITTLTLESCLSKEEIMYLYLYLSCNLQYPIFGLNNAAKYLGAKDLKSIKLQEFEPIFCILPSTTNIIRKLRTGGIASYGETNLPYHYDISGCQKPFGH